VNPSLEGYSAEVFATFGSDRAELGRLAEELSAIDRLVSTNATLLSGITDTSVPAPSRRAILADLLEGKVSGPARRLATFAAGAASAPKIPIALGWLADRSARLAGGDVDEPAPLSYLASRERVGGFAAAVFEDVEVADLDEIEDELFRFARVLESSPSLRAALINRDLPLAVREGVARELLEGKVRPATVRLVEYVLAGGRPRDVVGTLDWLVEETARARGWRVARVRSANEVESDQRDGLSESLAALAGRPVELQVIVDHSLLSGAIVDIGDLRVDASARGRLNEMRERLIPAGWDEGSLLRPDDPDGITH
jgi:F-type H+-transporting ATPase subunit delta